MNAGNKQTVIPAKFGIPLNDEIAGLTRNDGLLKSYAERR
jgi:hypothetical protein